MMRASVRIVLDAADPNEVPLLEHAEQLDLGGQAHLADLIEEQRALGSQLESTQPAGVGPGERPLLVPEQLALQQRLGQGGAVDRDERAIAAGAVVVDQPGCQFLARAGRAGEQDGDGGVGDTPAEVADLNRGGALADELRIGSVGASQRLVLADHGRQTAGR